MEERDGKDLKMHSLRVCEMTSRVRCCQDVNKMRKDRVIRVSLRIISAITLLIAGRCMVLLAAGDFREFPAVEGRWLGLLSMIPILLARKNIYLLYDNGKFNSYLFPGGAYTAYMLIGILPLERLDEKIKIALFVLGFVDHFRLVTGFIYTRAMDMFRTKM
jgi:hypothetical protein